MSAFLGALLIVLAGAAHAFPDRAIKLYVPSGPGVPPDIVARLVAAPLAARLGQPVVVENRPGTHAAVSVAEALADGHTLALAHTGFAIAPAIAARPGYDVVKSFAPIGRIATAPLVLLVHADVPARTLDELIALARTRELHFVAPNGTLPQVAGYLLMSSGGARLTAVPYKTASLAYPDLIAGRVEIMFDAIGAHHANLQAGKLRALAVAGPARLEAQPDLPTTREAGLPELQAIAFFGLVAPAGTPAAVVARLAEALADSVRTPETQAALRRQGLEPGATSALSFAEFIAAEAARWAATVRAVGLKPD